MIRKNFHTIIYILMLTLILAIFFQIVSISNEINKNNKVNSLESITGYSIIENQDKKFSSETYFRYYLFVWSLLIIIGLLTARLIIPRIKNII